MINQSVISCKIIFCVIIFIHLQVDLSPETTDAVEYVKVTILSDDGSIAYEKSFDNIDGNGILLSEKVVGNIVLTFYLKDNTTSFILTSVCHFCVEPTGKIIYKTNY